MAATALPTEAELQDQWKKVVDLFETTRVYLDETLASQGGSGLIDVLQQSLEGEYTPEISSSLASYRAAASSLVAPGRVRDFLEPIILEYGQVIAETVGSGTGFGSGYSDVARLFRAVFEHFVNNTLTVETRAITYDSSATTSNGFGGAIVGTGSITRLTVDEHNEKLEACHVERKTFRCRLDQNSGVDKHAEAFEFIGDPQSPDSLLRSAFGSGVSNSTTLQSLHAGAGSGGSLLRNSSFSTFDSAGSPKFNGWTESAGGANIAQSKVAAEVFRGSPGVAAADDASLKITGGSGIVTLKQTLDDMSINRLDANTPYFLRVMLNKTEGTASGGIVALRLGSRAITVTIAALGTNWQELLIPADTNTWFNNFNQDSFDIEIEWDGSSASGYLLMDDLIFSPYTLIDGTYWVMRGAATPWKVDDTLIFTDTGGAPATGKVQYYNWISGLGYLPSSATPSMADPA